MQGDCALTIVPTFVAKPLYARITRLLSGIDHVTPPRNSLLVPYCWKARRVRSHSVLRLTDGVALLSRQLRFFYREAQGVRKALLHRFDCRLSLLPDCRVQRHNAFRPDAEMIVSKFTARLWLLLPSFVTC